jgi:hypothetical protein
MPTLTDDRRTASLPIVGAIVLAGAAGGAVGWLTDHRVAGNWALGLAGVAAFVILSGGTSELVDLVKGGVDERQQAIAFRASLFAYYVLLVLVTGAAVIEVATQQGRPGPFTAITIAGTFAYTGALLILRART